jgi:hypothetical protein
MTRSFTHRYILQPFAAGDEARGWRTAWRFFKFPESLAAILKRDINSSCVEGPDSYINATFARFFMSGTEE